MNTSEVFTVITETREAAAVKLISVVVKRFTDVCLFIRVQLVERLNNETARGSCIIAINKQLTDNST
ncbi:hypothetical protein [Staphylococcus aureus]|uniref:hypothetical protein n=1 Tax=Staphylococcus aureus TaxID=1280 RepID=UPI003D13E121